MKLLWVIIISITSLAANAQVCNYADSVIDFSSEWSTSGWSNQKVLGPFDTYPCYGDISTAWATSASSGQLEFIELYFDNDIPIDSIYIFQTYHAGAIDSVFVKNPSDNQWEAVYIATPSAINTSTILKIGFPLTNFVVNEVKITFNSILVPGWNELDAVAISSNYYDVREEVIISCDAATVQISGTCGTSSIGDATFLWTTSDGNIVSGQTTPTATVDAPGVYYLTITKEGVNTQFELAVSSDITIPNIDDINDMNACESLTLPEITGENLTGNEKYYTGINGTGTSYTAGSVLSYSDFTNYPMTLYAHDSNGNGGICSSNKSFEVTIYSTPSIDAIQDMTVCDEYILPEPTVGAYYSLTSGGGTNYQGGDIISTNQQIFLYATEGTCTAEVSFDITVVTTPDISMIETVQTCDQYILPEILGQNLSGNEQYYSASNGEGMAYSSGITINFSDFTTYPTTLFVYDSGTLAGCSDEISFELNISQTPSLSLIDDITACEIYTLPILDEGNYYTQPDGTGSQLNEGDELTNTQEIYVHSSNGTCNSEVNFTLTITPTPTISTIEDQVICGEFVLPEISFGNYFTLSDGQGELLVPGTSIDNTQQLFIYSGTEQCSNEDSFELTVFPVPTLDEVSNIISYDSYILPALSNGNYYTGPMGTGTLLESGDELFDSQTIFIYAENDNCYNELNFEVLIEFSPIPPPCVDILSPLDGANNEGMPVQFTWTSAYSAIGYQLTLALASNSSNVIDNLDVGNTTYYTPSITWEDNTTYRLTIIAYNDHGASEGCQSIMFTTEDVVLADELIPTFFTPNDDGVNDYWQIDESDIDIKSVKIYDRYGKLLANFSTLTQGWDGVFNGYPMPSDDYWFVLDLYSGEIIKGHFSLIRK